MNKTQIRIYVTTPNKLCINNVASVLGAVDTASLRDKVW